MKYNRAAIKQEVSQAMRQSRPHPALVTLLHSMIVGAVSLLLAALLAFAFFELLSLLAGLMPSIGNLLLDNVRDTLSYYLEDWRQFFINPIGTILQMLLEMVIESLAVILLILFLLLLAVWVISFVYFVVLTVWVGLMGVGYCGYCLDMSLGADPQLMQIFDGFRRAGTVILTFLLAAVSIFLWNLLFSVAAVAVYALAYFLASVIPFVGWVLAILLGLAAPAGQAVGLVWSVCRYAMVPFALTDSGGRASAREALRTSKTLMKGRTGKYLGLLLSFAGWALLTVLIGVAGITAALVVSILFSAFAVPAFLIAALLSGAGIFILSLWLIPYFVGCNARFYIYAADSVQLSQPIPAGVQPVQPDYYGGQPGQPGYYGVQPGQPGYYDGQPGQPGYYGGQPQGGQPPEYPAAPGGTPQPPGGPNYPPY